VGEDENKRKAEEEEGIAKGNDEVNPI